MKKEKLKAGDFVEIYGALCLLVDKTNWGSEDCEGYLAVVLLKCSDGRDWFEMGTGYQIDFEEGRYNKLTREEGLRRLGE